MADSDNLPRFRTNPPFHTLRPEAQTAILALVKAAGEQLERKTMDHAPTKIDDATLAEWADKRADDAGRLARELRPIRELIAALPETLRVVNARTRTFIRAPRELVLNQLAAIMSGGDSVEVVDDKREHTSPALERLAGAYAALAKYDQALADREHGHVAAHRCIDELRAALEQ